MTMVSSNLPEEVLVKIWSFLPFRSILRFRSVHSFFNTLPSRPHFQDLCFTNPPSLQPPPPPPLFLDTNLQLCPPPPLFLGTNRTVHGRPIPCYSPVRSEWSLLPPDFIRFEGRNGYSSDVLAAAEGLICCSKHPAGAYPNDPQLVVGNPFTKHKVHLPPPPVSVHLSILASLAITGSHGGELAFKLFLGVEGISVFDSTLSQWLTPAYPRNLVGKEILPRSRNIVIVDGFWYVLVYSPFSRSWLLGIDIESPGMPTRCMGSWLPYRDKAQVYDEDGQLLDSLPVSDLCTLIVECKGQVGLAGIIMQGEQERDKVTIGIFVYDKCTKSWERRWVLPQDMAEDFLGDCRLPWDMAEAYLSDIGQQIRCATAGDLILFTSKDSSHGILFDTAKESWSWAFQSLELPCVRMFPSHTIVTFYPRLDTRPALSKLSGL